MMKNNTSIFFMILCLLLSIGIISSYQTNKPVIKIGILHSLSGTMAFSEKPLVDILTMAIDETNANGKTLGSELVAIIADGQSDPATFAKQAERLIVEEKVSVIFGCWTSACRKAVKPIIEKHQHLLFYPLQYEGIEQSTDIVYTGATPNQQITPSISWALKHLGKSFFLVGSDYIFPHTANQIIKDLLKAQQGTVVAEHYLPLGSNQVQGIIDAIEKQQPEVILNTINGDSNIAFFKALKQISPIPVISYSIAEPEVATIGSEFMLGHYAAWNYFQTINSVENSAFIAKVKQRLGQQQLINDPMEASYIALNLWVKAVKHAQSFEPKRVKSVIGRQRFNAPEGIVSVDSATQHLWKTARIGRVDKNGQFTIVWQSERPIQPVPYPSYKTKQQWETIQTQLATNELLP